MCVYILFFYFGFSFKLDNVLLMQNHYLCEDKVARQTLVNAISGNVSFYIFIFIAFFQLLFARK